MFYRLETAWTNANTEAATDVFDANVKLCCDIDDIVNTCLICIDEMKIIFTAPRLFKSCMCVKQGGQLL